MVSFLRYFRTARLNAGVAKVLQDWAFAAPIPVKVDGRKINTLHACPTNREGSKKQVLVAVFLQQVAVEGAHHIGCCVLLTVGSKYDASEMREFRWRRKPPGSLFYWVQSGVVIQSERLPSLGVGLSWAILRSAELIPPGGEMLERNVSKQVNAQGKQFGAPAPGLFVLGSVSLTREMKFTGPPPGPPVPPGPKPVPFLVPIGPTSAA